MKKSLFLGISFVLCIYVLSCKDKLVEPDVEYFIIKVDSIQMPDTFYLTNEGLSIAFWGYIGHTSCYQFSYFEVYQDTTNLRITVWGKLVRTPCFDLFHGLNGRKYYVTNIQEGTLYVRINQPDGSFLRDSIVIK